MPRFSTKPARNSYPFPEMMGNEQEIGMLVKFADGDIDEPYDLAERLDEFLPYGVVTLSNMLSNGAKLYPGGSNETYRLTNIEYATPECLDPLQLLECIRSGQAFIEGLCTNYLSLEDDVAQIYVNHRVVDSSGSRKGMHDSFAYDTDMPAGFSSALCFMLAARNLVCGAGYQKKGGYFLSQKFDGIREVNNYGYFGTVFRTDAEHGQGVEIRCGDVNISDWATLQRLGITAMFLAIMRIKETRDVFFEHMDGEFHDHELLKSTNNIRITPDSSLQLTTEQTRLVTVLRLMADLVLDTLPLHSSEVPDGYRKLAQELLLFCEDLSEVAADNQGIALLADRCDWALKAVMMQDRVERKELRTRSDIVMCRKAVDISYAHVLLDKSPDGSIKMEHGPGLRYRDRGKFRPVTKEKLDASKHLRKPPTGISRVAQRVEAIKSGQHASIGWDYAQ